MKCVTFTGMSYTLVKSVIQRDDLRTVITFVTPSFSLFLATFDVCIRNGALLCIANLLKLLYT